MKRKKLLSLLLTALLLAGCLTIPSKAQQDNRVIRVGYPIQAGLTDKDENGDYSGYTYEYLEEIAQYTGWEFEFVELPGSVDESFSAMLEMLQAGDLDLLGGMTYSDQLASVYDYVGQSYGTAHTVLCVPTDVTAVSQDNYRSLEPIRVAAYEKAKTRIGELDEFCQLNGLSYEIVPCQSEEELDQAVREGRADAILDVDLNCSETRRVITKFSPRPYYFATTKGNDEVAKRISAAISGIDEIDPYFSTMLYETYFNAQNKSLNLSDSDRAYLEQTSRLRVGVLLDRPPFQYKDPDTGELRGISIDLIRYIGEKTGLSFDLIEVATQEELDRMTTSGELDLVASVPYDYQSARKQGISLTRPFASAQYVMVLNQRVASESLQGKRLALPYWFTFDEDYTGNVKSYGSLEECIQAVNAGEADYTYGNAYSIQYYLNNPVYRNLHSIPQTYSPEQTCLGAVHAVDNQLLRIVNKVVVSMPEGEMQSIIYQNTSYEKDYSLRAMIEANPAASLILIGSLAFFIILVLLWVLYLRIRMNRKTKMDLKKHYQLYELSNEHFFEYDCAQKILTVFAKQGDGPSEKKNRRVYDLKRTSQSASDPVQECKKHFFDILESNGDGIEDARLPQPDGPLHWMRISYRTICDEGGKPVCVIGKFTDIENEKREINQLLDRAQKDSLTSLYNAAACRSLISQSLASLAPGEQSALFIVDIDRFKTINDDYGHFTGDQILIETSEALRSVFRKEDIVGRLGGDEFIIHIKNIQSLRTINDRCVALCEKMRAIRLPQKDLVVSVSIGAAAARAGESFDSLYQRTDRALYEVKNKGRDGFEIDRSIE